MMKRKSSGLFIAISNLMFLLHILRGNNITFIINSWIPYALYYITIGLYMVGNFCLICRVFRKTDNLPK